MSGNVIIKTGTLMTNILECNRRNKRNNRLGFVRSVRYSISSSALTAEWVQRNFGRPNSRGHAVAQLVEVASSIPDVTGLFHWHNPSGCTRALGQQSLQQK